MKTKIRNGIIKTIMGLLAIVFIISALAIDYNGIPACVTMFISGLLLFLFLYANQDYISK